MNRRGAMATVGLLVGIGALTGCTKETGTDPGVPSGSFGLVAFDTCQQALDNLRGAARAVVGPYGFGGGIAVDAGAAREATNVAPPAAPGAVAADSAGAAAKTSTSDTPTYSGTNTHESGVDEPDLVKTDGRRIVTVS